MVALALAAMISVSIMFISSQARLAYEGTVKKIDVYNRFRCALKAIESDIKGWVPTSELEFYTDGRGKGARVNSHWDVGEEVPDPPGGAGVVDGGEKGYDEYAHIVERHYISRERMQAEDKIHDAYQLYFRTLTFVDGAVREANVEYMLVDPNYDSNNEGAVAAPASRGGKEVASSIPQPPRRVKPEYVQDLTLIKIIRYYDISYKNIHEQSVTPIKRQVREVCSNVTDFRIEYLVDKDFRGKVTPGFRTPKQDFEKPAEIVTRPKHEPNLGVSGGYRKIFGYGTMKLGEKVELATALPARRGDDNLAKGGGGTHTPLQFGFQGSQSISFTELTPGDKIFIFTASSRGEVAGGAAAGVAGNASKLLKFPAGDYTVKTNHDGLLEFEEDIDSTEWNGQTQNGIYYKAAFMPAAVRVTLRVVDDNGENPKTLQREIWLRRRSR